MNERKLIKRAIRLGGASAIGLGAGFEIGNTLRCDEWDGINFELPEVLIVLGIIVAMFGFITVTDTETGERVW